MSNLRNIKPRKWQRSSMDWLIEMVEKLTGYEGSEAMDLALGIYWHETEIECLTGKCIPRKWNVTENGEKVQVQYKLKRVTEVIKEMGEDPLAPYGPFNAAKKIAEKFMEKHRGLVVGEKVGLI